MSDQMKSIEAGARVRVRDPDGFVYAVKIKVRDRIGIVRNVFVPPGRHTSNVLAIVDFEPRRKGGLPYHGTFPVRDLEATNEA